MPQYMRREHVPELWPRAQYGTFRFPERESPNTHRHLAGFYALVAIKAFAKLVALLVLWGALNGSIFKPVSAAVKSWEGSLEKAWETIEKKLGVVPEVDRKLCHISCDKHMFNISAFCSANTETRPHCEEDKPEEFECSTRTEKRKWLWMKRSVITNSREKMSSAWLLHGPPIAHDDVITERFCAEWCGSSSDQEKWWSEKEFATLCHNILQINAHPSGQGT